MDTPYYPTLSVAVDALEKQGFTEDFSLAADHLNCAALGLQFHPEDFEIVQYYRFEGMTNPEDMSVVYAIESKNGIRGLLIDAYGTYAETLSAGLLEKLRLRP